MTLSMGVDRLALDDFRSWGHLVVDFSPGLNVLIGRNGIGKTNIVEAMEFLSVGSSHRASASRWLVRRGAAHATIRANARTGTASGAATGTASDADDTAEDIRQVRLQVTLPARGAVRARLNDGPSRYFGDIAGLLKVVLFSPSDEQLVSGAPQLRRDFLNQTCVLMDPGYYRLLQQFRQTARQRSAVLHRLQGDDGLSGGEDRRLALAELEAWTAQFTTLGIAVTRARQAAVKALAPLVEEIYAGLSGGRDSVRPVYRPSFEEVLGSRESDGDNNNAEDGTGSAGNSVGNKDIPPEAAVPSEADARTAIARHFQRLYAGEVARGTSLIGPQRDDVDLLLDGEPARQTASNGEMWTIALALRMAQYRWLAARGPRPVLVLDDVFSQLDEHRRAQILAFARGCGQVFITVAARSDIPRGVVGTDAIVTDAGDDTGDTGNSGTENNENDGRTTGFANDVIEDAVEDADAVRLIDVEALARAQEEDPELAHLAAGLKAHGDLRPRGDLQRQAGDVIAGDEGAGGTETRGAEAEASNNE
jgi:DNA replication and repair protein RecF